MSDAELFAGPYIDRSAGLRRDPVAMETAWRDAGTRFLPLWQSRCLLREESAARLSRAEMEQWLPPAERAVFLGTESGRALFAVALEGGEQPPLGDFATLRELIQRVPASDAGVLGYARAMLHWQAQHRHCGVCGTPTQAEQGGFLLRCRQPDCGQRCFPRLDPAVIVLVHRDQQCLLGRKPGWPDGRFSTIAGFVEPGEAPEDAVRREVAEETNIAVGGCDYLGSQPWPFPASLMLGFHAWAESEDIRLNDAELAEARWFSREELAAGLVTLPPRPSIAFRLVEAWFDAVPGPGLAKLGRFGAFLAPS